MSASEACISTGNSLSVLKNVIILEWENLVRQVIAVARHESSIILRDHVPEILDELVSILNHGTVDETEMGKAHGYYRSVLTNYSVADLLTEYSLLREILVTYIYPFGGDMNCAKIVHKFIDILTKHAVVEFINEQIVHRSLPADELGSEAHELKSNPIIPTIN